MEQRWSKLAAPNSATELPKLLQQSAPDNANFLEFACNVSSVFSLQANFLPVKSNDIRSSRCWVMYVFKYEESLKRGECGGVFCGQKTGLDIRTPP